MAEQRDSLFQLFGKLWNVENQIRDLQARHEAQADAEAVATPETTEE